MERLMKILMVLTSVSQVPGKDRKTGTWLEELAAPYYTFLDAGAQVTLASVAGGSAPIDPASESAASQTEATRRFIADPVAQKALANTVKLADMRAQDFDGVFYSGGLGPVFDLTDNQQSIALIETMQRAGKPVAAVCHASAVFRKARTP